jgi:hypothetical protein
MMPSVVDRERGERGVSAGVLSSVHVQGSASLTPGEGGTRMRLKIHISLPPYENLKRVPNVIH